MECLIRKTSESDFYPRKFLPKKRNIAIQIRPLIRYSKKSIREKCVINCLIRPFLMGHLDDILYLRKKISIRHIANDCYCIYRLTFLASPQKRFFWWPPPSLSLLLHLYVVLHLVWYHSLYHSQ